MKTQSQDLNAYVKSLVMIHYAVLFGALMFGAIIVFLTIEESIYMMPDIQNDPFFVVVVAMALMSLSVSEVIYRKKVSEARDKAKSNENQLMIYRTAVIVRAALIEGALLFTLIVFMLSTNRFYLIIALILLFRYLMFHPTKEKIINELQLRMY